MSDVKIEVNNLYKIFGGSFNKIYEYISQGFSRDEIMKKTGSIVGLRNINFEVKKGETFVIMGLSGSGKSTLLRCINRLIEPTYGSIKIDGNEITDFNSKQLRELRKNEFGMVFQGFALFPNRNVIDNIVFGLEIKGVPQKERYEKGYKALEEVGLQGWEYKPITSLSGGMQQRVGLARAMASDPNILLMDEPFSALDPLIRVKMQEELLNLQKQMQKTILFVTHDLNEAMRIGDKIGIMNSEGEMIQIASPEEIIMNPVNDYVKQFIGDVDIPSVIRTERIFKSTQNYIEYDSTIKDAKDLMEKNNTYYLYAVSGKKYEGIIFWEDIVSNSNKSAYVKDFISEIKGTSKLSPIKNILPVIINYGISAPIVDDDNNLIGQIGKDALSDILEKI